MEELLKGMFEAEFDPLDFEIVLCPHCGAELIINPTSTSEMCPVCKSTITVKNETIH